MTRRTIERRVFLCQVGDLVPCTAQFTNGIGQLADPSQVLFLLTNPAGVTISETYGVGGTITRDSVGAYHRNVDIDGDGDWYARFEGNGAVQAGNEIIIRTAQSRFY